MSASLSVSLNSSTLSISGEFDSSASGTDRYTWGTACTHLLTVVPSGGTIDADGVPIVDFSDPDVEFRILQFEVNSAGTELKIWLSAFMADGGSASDGDVSVTTDVDTGSGTESVTGYYAVSAISSPLPF